eukprot:jgi/Botrbrau1/2594/Bobra.145_1s0020.1
MYLQKQVSRHLCPLIPRVDLTSLFPHSPCGSEDVTRTVLSLAYDPGIVLAHM